MVGDPLGPLVAAAALDTFDVVLLQHEYGIFGGPDGEDVLDVVGALHVPLVTVAHTALENPSPNQRRVLCRLVAASAAVVCMTWTARKRLIELYGASPDAVEVIPHGAPNLLAARPPRRAEARPVILTWGLLGPGKGIEWAVDALPELRDLNPRYLVVGQTHPRVQAEHGETYREGLRRRADAQGVGDLLHLDASYLPTAELARVVAASDVVLLPYDSVEQVTSGVLIEAVAAGRPVVSTAFPHAVELLSSGPGLLVPRQDPGALAAALRRVLTEDGLATALESQAQTLAPTLRWPAVARSYADLAGRVLERQAVGAR